MLQLFTMSKKSPPKFKDGVSYVSDFMVSFHILLKNALIFSDRDSDQDGGTFIVEQDSQAFIQL